MRREFVCCKSIATAARKCPWARQIVKTDGGYLCFESIVDYINWRNQK